MSDICSLTAEQVTAELARGALSPTEVLEATLARAERVGSVLDCFTTIRADEARAEARRLERSSSARKPPLWGLPITVKDQIAVAGTPTTAGSTVTARTPAAADGAVAAALRGAGAIVVAKTAMYEFAFGAPNPAYGITRNPWDLQRTTGGSSSGSVAAVAARIGYASVGTDTGGSIRVPAGFCGVVGLKPTFGRVPTDGVVPVSWTLDHVGPIARTVRDCALLLNSMSRPDVPPVDVGTLDGGVADMRIAAAIPDAASVDPVVRQLLERAVAALAAEAACVDPVELPDLLAARTCLWTISSAEAADYHRTMLDRHGDRYHPLVRRRLLRGRVIPAADYVRAQRVRARLASELAQAVDGYDALVLPLAPVAAYDLYDRTVRLPTGAEDASAAVTRYTPLFSLTGWPALAVPVGLTPGGLPVGIQVVARPRDEVTVLRVGRAVERAAGAERLRPPEPERDG